MSTYYHLDVNLQTLASEVAALGITPVMQNITGMLTQPVSFSSVAQGGFATCTLTLVCDDVAAAKFLDEHVGRRITIHSPYSPYADNIVWDGQIQQVTVDDGKRSVARSMDSVYNTVSVEYTEAIIIGGSNYYEGETKVTTPVINLASTYKYGTRELIYTAGVMTEDAAYDYAARLLYDYSQPQNRPGAASIGGAGGGMAAVRVDCAGWYEGVGQRYYYDTGTALTTVSAQIAATLNTTTLFMSSDTSNVATISTPYLETQAENIPAKEYIDRMCAVGGANNRRAYFGMYEEGRPYLFEEAATTKYYISRYDTSEVIIDATTGLVVPPYLIRPGYIAEFLDFLPVGIENYTNIKYNPRAFVIGVVEYQAPNIVRLTPLVTDPASLNMARMDWGQMLWAQSFAKTDDPASWPDPYPNPPAPPTVDLWYPIPLPGQPPPSLGVGPIWPPPGGHPDNPPGVIPQD